MEKTKLARAIIDRSLDTTGKLPTQLEWQELVEVVNGVFNEQKDIDKALALAGEMALAVSDVLNSTPLQLSARLGELEDVLHRYNNEILSRL